jgi:hypothetical protein
MKITEMLTWARSLSNLSTSKAISPDDEDKSFNASWKDLYARFLESNDDYFTKTVTVTPIAPYLIATNEYLIPLPEDFYQLRTAEYQDGTTAGTWIPLDKFPLSSRTDTGFGHPSYRMDNNSLWLRGQSVSAVRVKYYPPPATLTHPQPDLQYATSVTPNNFALISSPVYAAWKNTGVYVYNANITEGSIDDNTTGAPVTLLAVAATNLAYYKGYLYYIAAGKIRRAPTDLVTTPIVPADVIASGTVTSFAIFKDVLYYTDAGSMYTATLAGGGSALLLAVAGTWISVAASTVYYVLTGALKSGATTIIASGVSACTSDGTNLYILTTLGEVRKLVVAGTLLVSSTVLRTDVTAIGPWAANRIPIITGESQQLLAFSSIIDTDVTYPLNVVLEIMSYQAAIDFRTKIGGEFDFAPLYARLGHPKGTEPATGLWARFEQAVKRDEYKPERVSNSRRVAGNW